MTVHSPTARRTLRDIFRGGAALAAAMLGLSIVTAFSANALPAGSPPTPGQSVSPTSGAADTEFSLLLASPNNVCPGDTATGNFRWNVYVAASSVDAGAVTWAGGTGGGPVDAGGGFVQTMYSHGGGNRQWNKNTAINTGQIVGTVTLDFLANLVPGNGVYHLGYACTKVGTPGTPAITERYWQSQITVTEWVSATQFRWAVSESATTTTVAGATTTTTVTGATTTTVAGATTTTVAGATTTTKPATTTTSTTLAGATTTSTTIAVASAAPTTTLASSFATSSGGFGSGVSSSGGGVASSGSAADGAFPVTGPSHAVRIAFWALLLLAFGRMAVLMARPIRVLPPDAR